MVSSSQHSAGDGRQGSASEARWRRAWLALPQPVPAALPTAPPRCATLLHAAPAGRPGARVHQPGRKMLRSGSSALQRLTKMVGKSRQIYKV